MSTTPSGAAERRDLRTELLRLARELLETKGAAALSIREVARRVGCTHQAPYHYFGSREGLLDALAEVGAAELAGLLTEANADAEVAGGAVAVEAVANAYVAFALANPNLYRLMFATETPQGAAVELTRLAGLCRRGPRGAAGDEERRLALWAHMHGLASLLLSDERDAAGRLAAARSVNRAVAPGLAGPADARPRGKFH